MVQLATSRVLQRKNDAQALAELGNRLATFDEYDAAIKLLERAQNIRQRGSLDDRLRQLEMNKRLANAFLTYKTPHFEIHYPQEVGPRFAESMGSILEKEFARLQTWVPVPQFKPVIINVLEWRDFRATYTGSDFILGFYEGKITLPFAGVDRFSPLVVTILSHELLHAMLAQATHGQAPHWFQEGLAQRIEMKSYSPNAFNMYTDEKLLAVSLLDAVLRGSPDPDMIEQAYIESQTTIRYVEAKYGPGGVTKLIAAFRDGATTEDAIQQLSGAPLAKFDADMRVWGRSASHVFDNPPIIDYAPEETGIQFSTRRSQ
jgi:Peptidase MA superfamily